MRIAIMVLLLLTTTAAADKLGWGGVGFGFGGPLQIDGKLKTRTEREACGSSCPLTGRALVGGGYGNWGGELQIMSGPLIDTSTMDVRDRRRHAFTWGPMVRRTLVRKWGFDLSIRAGAGHGHVFGEAQEAQGVGCDGPCPTTTYEPPKYALWWASLGATAMVRLKIEHGYIGAFADLDYTFVRVAYPDGGVTGGLSSKTYGVVFGSMFRG